MRTYTTISTMLLLAVVALTARSDEPRVLSQSEKAKLLGGQTYNNYFNSCCARSSQCVLRTTIMCTTWKTPKICNAAEAFYYAPNNQNTCSGVLNNQICASDVNSVVCVVSYNCSINPDTGQCWQNPTQNYTAVASAPTSCTPACEQPTGPGGS